LLPHFFESSVVDFDLIGKTEPFQRVSQGVMAQSQPFAAEQFQFRFLGS